MEDFNGAYGALVSYVDYLEAQAQVIRDIRENELSLEKILKKGPNIQKCANEIETQMNPRESYLFGYVEKFLELDNLTDTQKEYLEGIRERIFKYQEEFGKPLVKVSYESI